MKKVAKWLLSLLLLLTFIMAYLYFYFIYQDTPVEPKLGGDFKRATLNVGGIDRSFSSYVPTSLAPHAPLLFVLHGSKSQGEVMRVGTDYGFEKLADREGFIVVYPDGYDNHWNDCRGSASYAANTENVDDPAFFRAMIAFFANKYGISPERVFAMGLSNGGHMAYRLAFEMPEAFSAVAAFAANLPVESSFDCTRSNKPVSIAVFNGTQDPINPYNGGLVTLFGDTSRGEVMSADASVEYWARLAGVVRGPVTKQFPEQDGDSATSISSKAWASNRGVLVRLYTLHGSGHVIPSRNSHRIERFLGGSAGDMDGVEEVWTFFKDAETEQKSTRDD